MGISKSGALTQSPEMSFWFQEKMCDRQASKSSVVFSCLGIKSLNDFEQFNLNTVNKAFFIFVSALKKDLKL